MNSLKSLNLCMGFQFLVPLAVFAARLAPILFIIVTTNGWRKSDWVMKARFGGEIRLGWESQIKTDWVRKRKSFLVGESYTG
jgi:hypothetical protein